VRKITKRKTVYFVEIRGKRGQSIIRKDHRFYCTISFKHPCILI
jgi:hypothetical protein